MSIEAMKQALEALENSQRFVEASANAKMLHGWGEQLDTAEDAITSLRQAIAEAEKQEQGEPVGEAYLCDCCLTPFDGAYECPSCGHNSSTKEAVYITPQQRTWVGLTDEQIEKIRLETLAGSAKGIWLKDFARAIEAAHGIKGEA